MGLHFSRLALAIALCLPIGVPLMAADQLDEFYIEIKGPDKPVSPLIAPVEQPAPAATTPAPRTAPAAKPANKQKKPKPRVVVKAGEVRPFIAAEIDSTASAGSYGPVKGSDTLWSIAQQVRPSNQVSVYQTLLAIYRKNPKAFANGRVSSLYRGSYLQLPTIDQIRSESESLAQELVRKGSMTLPKASAVKSDSASASETTQTAAAPAQKVVKLTPPVEQKPVVKLTPDNSSVVDSRVAEVTATSAAASTLLQPASAAVSAADTSAVASAQEQVGSHLTITSQASAASEAVASVADTAQPAAMVDEKLQAMQRDYKNQIDSLSQDNSALKNQVSQMEKELQSIKALLAKGDAKEPVAPAAASGAETASAAVATEESSFWSELTATPLNLALLLILPFLLVLALVTLWLVARSKREQAARQYDESDSADSLMADGDSHFDHLLAADMVAMSSLPDLDQRDETVQPQPEIILDEDRQQPVFSTASAFSPNKDAEPKTDPELLPEFNAASSLDHDDLDLSIPSAPSEEQLSWGSRSNDAPLDEAAFLSELGSGGLDALPEAEPPVTSYDMPLQPEVVVEQDDFVPRQNVNLSNDELDALFDSVDDLAATEAVRLDEELPVASQGDLSVDADTMASQNSPADVEPELDVDALLAANQQPAAESQEEMDLRASLAVPDEPRSAAVEALPAADWYQEDVEPAASQTVSADDIDALLDAQQATTFKPIDELLAEADAIDNRDEPYEGLSLDVGLDEFPEVLPESQGVDVDVDGELAAKLDLARAYLEIDDKTSAVELLNEVLQQGDNEQRAEAQRLLKRIS